MKAAFVPTMIGLLSLLYLLVKTFLGDAIRSVDLQRRQTRRQLELEEDAAFLGKLAASTFGEAVVLLPTGNSTTGVEMRQWLQAQGIAAIEAVLPELSRKGKRSAVRIHSRASASEEDRVRIPAVRPRRTRREH